MHTTNSDHIFHTSQHNNNHHDQTRIKSSFCLSLALKKFELKHPANGTTSVARRTKQTCLLNNLPCSNNRLRADRCSPFLSITLTNSKHMPNFQLPDNDLSTNIGHITRQGIHSTRAKNTTILYLALSNARNKKEISFIQEQDGYVRQKILFVTCVNQL